MSDIYQIGAPAFIPEQRRQLPRLLRESLDAVQPPVIEALEQLLDQPVPEVFLRVEEAVLHLFQVASAMCSAASLRSCIRMLHGSMTWSAAAA